MTDRAPASSRPSLKWWARRYSLKHIFYRARLGARRRRWRAVNSALTAPYRKSPHAVAGSGPVLIVGDFRGSYGLSRGAAYDLAQIRAGHDDCDVLDVGALLYRDEAAPPNYIPRRRFGVVYLLCQPDTYGRILPLLDPDQIKDAYRIGRWAWETPLFPQAWRFACDLVHEVWAPSEFSAQVFRQAIDGPVRVYPHPVAAPIPRPAADRGRFGVADGVFFGLAIMDIQSCPERKNPWAHVEAWVRAFGDDPGALLILKIRLGKRTRVVADELRDMIGKRSNIQLFERDLDDDEITILQASCDVYLSLHRSEGFGLNIAECLALDKHVIATHWSANAEYGSAFVRYFGAPYRLVPYRDWMLHYEDRDFSWAEPDLDAIAHRLQCLRKSTMLGR